MKYPFRDDYAVKVSSEGWEWEAEIPETAHFFKDIYDVTLWGLVSNLRFVPAFSRSPEYWPEPVAGAVSETHTSSIDGQALVCNQVCINTYCAIPQAVAKTMVLAQ